MLTKLRIKNFKCLQDTGELDIRPLTFLVGPNSSGKTSLLQLLLMLRQTVDSTDTASPLITSDGWVKMGPYPEFIYGHDPSRALWFEIISSLERNLPHLQTHLRAELVYDSQAQRIVLKNTDVVAGQQLRMKVTLGEDKRYSAMVSHSMTASLIYESDDVEPYKFHGFRQHSEKELAEPGDLARGLGIPRIAEFPIRQIQHLGPLREIPQRFYVSTGQKPQDVGRRGEKTIDVLWQSRRDEEARIRELKGQTEKWLKQFGIAAKVKLDEFRDNYYRLMITDPYSGLEVNLPDVGFGVSQLLPIVVESCLAPAGSTLLIEQPEIHLHPKAQCVLGDLFVEAAQEADRSFIIETHSEHVLARVRRRIAEKKISKDKIAIYYFDPSPDGTRITEVKLNDQGQYESFPEGFFEEDIDEAFEHLKAIAPTETK